MNKQVPLHIILAGIIGWSIGVLLAQWCSSAEAKPKTIPTLLVVEAAQQVQAEAAVVSVCGPKAKGTFVPGVECVGVGNRKYYVASGSWMTTEQITAFNAAMKTHVNAKRVQIFQAVKGRDKLKELKIGKVNK